MGQCLTALQVSLNQDDEEQLRAQGYVQLPENLNKGTKGNKMFLWYKIDQMQRDDSAISRIQFSYNDNMAKGLIDAGYSKIEKSLNKGASRNSIYLWYYRGSLNTECPIMEIDVTTDIKSEVARYIAGWETLSCNLDRSGGESCILLWGKRLVQMYICDITATAIGEEDADLFQKNYIRVDEAINQNTVFIWYQLTNDEKQALRDLKVSITDEEFKSYKAQGYTLVNKNLNEGTGGNPKFLWYKKDGPGNPIKAVSVLTNKATVEALKHSGANVIEKNLTEGKKGATEYLCFINTPPPNPTE